MNLFRNVQIKQSIVLFLIVAAEIFCFNKEWKYSLVRKVCPFLETCFSQNMPYIKLVFILLMFIVVLVLFTSLKNVKKDSLFIIFLIKGFQIKGSDVIGVFNVLFTLCSIAWIGNEIFRNSLHGFLNAIIYSEFLLLYPLFVVKFITRKELDKPEPKPKLLITALSIQGWDKEKQKWFLELSLEEMEKPQYKTNWMDYVFVDENNILRMAGSTTWGPWGNLDPIRKSIILHHQSLKEIYLIASKDVQENLKKLPENLQPVKLIEDFLKRLHHQPNIKVTLFNEDFTGNQMDEAGEVLNKLIRKAFRENYHDEDILFSITGGTAVITGAMILKAMISDRKAEYCNQQKGIMEAVPVSIFDVKDLWHELLEKIP